MSFNNIYLTKWHLLNSVKEYLLWFQKAILREKILVESFLMRKDSISTMDRSDLWAQRMKSIKEYKRPIGISKKRKKVY